MGKLSESVLCHVASGPGSVSWAILASALIGAGFAWRTIYKHRQIARKRAALDFLIWMSQDLSDELELEVVELLNKEPNYSELIHSESTSELAKQKLMIQKYLNGFELMCACIKDDVVDENVLKSVIGDKLVTRWSEASPFIATLRKEKGDNEFYEHFEDIAREWANSS